MMGKRDRRVTDWLCQVSAGHLIDGMEKTNVGRSSDPQSPLYGIFFHFLQYRSGSAAVHLIGSDGPARGAIAHTDADPLGRISSHRCVIPGNAKARVESEFSPSDLLRIGIDQRSKQLVIENVAKPIQVCFDVLSGWGSRGLACFPDSSFTEVEPHTYWVKGGVRPVRLPGRATSRRTERGAGLDIFVEDDADDEEVFQEQLAEELELLQQESVEVAETESAEEQVMPIAPMPPALIVPSSAPAAPMIQVQALSTSREQPLRQPTSREQVQQYQSGRGQTQDRDG